jgi:hypothetical protein
MPPGLSFSRLGGDVPGLGFALGLDALFARLGGSAAGFRLRLGLAGFAGQFAPLWFRGLPPRFRLGGSGLLTGRGFFLHLASPWFLRGRLGFRFAGQFAALGLRGLLPGFRFGGFGLLTGRGFFLHLASPWFLRGRLRFGFAG